jgi:hypothetical protein
MDQLTTFPDEIVAGDYFNLKESLTDYPASDSWELTYTLINRNDKITLTSSASGDDHLIQVVIATTATWAAGDYHWQKVISDGTEKYTLATGQVTVTASYADVSSLDTRPHCYVMRDALRAVSENKATKDQQSYSIAGRSISRYSPAEIIDWLKYYEAKCDEYDRKLKRADGKATGSLIKVQF